MKKKLSLLLAVVMVLSSVIPMTVFAAGDTAISFETTFTEDMTVGDTFTVTASLANNPGLASIVLSLGWNEDALAFKGFDAYEDEFPVSEVLEARGWTVVTNHELGIIVASRTSDNSTNGTLFTANFEIVGSGDLNIVLKDTDASEFLLKNAEATASYSSDVIDYSAIEGLSVAAPEAEGPVIPDGAPFTAITTDAGDVIAITYQEDVSASIWGTAKDPVPYYHVQIPAGATEIYITHPSSVDPFCDSSYAAAYGYYADTASWSGNSFTFAFTDADDGYTVTYPVVGSMDTDWDGVADTEYTFVADEDGNVEYAIGMEKTNYDPICFFTFEYAASGGGESGGQDEPTTYPITVTQTTGGTVTVYNESMEAITEAAEGDYIFVDCAPDTGYSFKQLLIDGEPVELGMTNGFYTMPAKAITVSAVFEAKHTCTYDREVVDAKYLKSEATCQTGAVYYKSCECELFDKSETAETFISGDPVDCVYEDGACKWCGEAEPVLAPGYTFATSADVSAENGGTAVVHVKITGHSDETVTSYNAYDITLTFDSNKLEYQGYDGAVKSDNGSVTVEGNTIRIVGCGADKGFGTEIAALTFKTKAEGNANVTIDKVQVSDKEEAVKEDAPEATPKHDENDSTADETPDVSVIVVPYSVTKPGFVSGNEKILHGETYTFSYTDTTNYTYSGLTVTVGGVAVENLTADENGVYTIANVTDAIVITATQTPNSYDVTKPENVEGPDKATYGEDYIFTATPSKDDMAIDSVKVTDAAGNEITYTINEEGKYMVAGSDITGAFTITVTEKEKMTTITFTGIEETEIEGGKLTMTAEIGKDFTFKLIKDENFDYTVKIGENELTESEETAGQYTVPAELVVKGGVQVDITKEDNTKPVVDVAEYINLDDMTMFLVTAKWGDKVLAYGEEGTMFWSDKYTVTGETEAGAYCWLVLSTDEMNTVELVKAAAEAAIVEAAEGATATAIRYDYDVNGTTKVDVNDAQLAYDMYNASYMEFTDNLPMLKFLEADMETDSKLDTKDVAAIISYIVSGANA